jgi:hypothetical protein
MLVNTEPGYEITEAVNIVSYIYVGHYITHIIKHSNIGQCLLDFKGFIDLLRAFASTEARGRILSPSP